VDNAKVNCHEHLMEDFGGFQRDDVESLQAIKVFDSKLTQ
jgi:hypothetical protein